MENELGEPKLAGNGTAREKGREDRPVPSKEGHGDIVDREEPRRLERDRARVAFDNDGVEEELVGCEGLSATVCPVGDFKDVAADAK